MKRMLLAAAAVAALAGPPSTADARSTLVTPAGEAQMQAEWRRYPLFAQEVARAQREVETSLRAGVIVPIPKDSGGGYTHEQHKRNYKVIYQAGLLYRITGEARYADHARDLLLAYAELYPTLGRHPAGRGEIPGRLFWQTLNDSVWLVHGIQGYDAIRNGLTEAERARIEGGVFRPMAAFLSGTPANFDRIHNHATWAVAGVGMTGYVLGDRVLVEKALLGSDRSGRAGFLRQLDELFSPDGYYEEGPYYQRYALMPFVVFARAIETNEPERRIFQHRDGVLPKAIRTTIQLTYAGRFFPLNDAVKDKGLDTEELYHAVAIAYAQTGAPDLLSIADGQQRTVLSPDGLRVAQGLAEGRKAPFPFASTLLRDGPDGKRGGLAILRSGPGAQDQALVMKNTAQGMGHGHFDKLSWVFYDNGREVVTDYGAARFLNVETKGGGGYLPENNTWAKQTLAHNTLVVNGESHFGGELKRAEAAWPEGLVFRGDGQTKLASARMDGAYPGVGFRRTLALLSHPDLEHPIVLDVLAAKGSAPATYDLPLHYSGHITDLGFQRRSNTAERPVLGARNGYQHVWVDATAMPSAGEAWATWLLGGRFYTYRFLPEAGAELILAESGANDPDFNLRRQPLFIQRVTGRADAAFVSILEPHGEYNGAAEYTLAPRSRITALTRTAGTDADVVTVTLATGKHIVLALARDPDAKAAHRVTVDGRSLEWTGPYARFDR